SVCRSPPDQKLPSNLSDASLVRLIRLLLEKMMLQETKEAASRISITSLTGILASMIRCRIDISVFMIGCPRIEFQAVARALKCRRLQMPPASCLGKAIRHRENHDGYSVRSENSLAQG